MANCPACKSPDAYYGLMGWDCTTPGCVNCRKPVEPENKDPWALPEGFYWFQYEDDNGLIDLSCSWEIRSNGDVDYPLFHLWEDHYMPEEWADDHDEIGVLVSQKEKFLQLIVARNKQDRRLHYR